MKSTTPLRRRNISWRTDGIVRQLAFDKNMTVSELLERLVNAEAKRKRGIAHLHSREVAA